MPRLKDGEISYTVKNGVKYYRMSKGVKPDRKKPGSYSPMFWALGTDFRKALIKKALIEEVWMYPGEEWWNYPEGTPKHWTTAMVERVERFVGVNAPMRTS